ncbi:hypothetical protein APS67_003542 [Streptomyces sp. AVP053U2]|nr:hypothetical protein APS67_003542 [Streptomyces sp. AVP053U2]
MQAEGVRQFGHVGVGVGGREQDEPGTTRPRGGGAVQRFPHGAVAAGVGGDPFGATAPPRGQGGHEGGEGVVVEAEVGAEGGQVGSLDGVPERGVRAVGRAGRGRRGRPVGGVGPVAAVLEGVGGQVDAAGAGAVQDAGPVHTGAVDVDAGQGGGEGGDLVAVAAQRGHRGHVGVRRRVGVFGGVEGVACGGGQDAVGAEFQEGGVALPGEGAHGVGEADGGADLLDPVVGAAQRVGGSGLAGDGGHQRDGRQVVGEAAGDPGEVVEHGVHARRVEGVADAQGAGPAAVPGDPGGDPGDGVLLAGQDDGARAVDGGQTDLVLQALQQRQHLVLGGLHGDHGSAGRQGGHEAAPGGDEGAGVVQGEDARDVGGGEFTDGVAGDAVGHGAPGLDEPVEGHFEGEQGGLGVGGVVQEGRVPGALLGEQHVPQGVFEFLVEAGEDVVQGVREGRVAAVQFAAHGGALAALSGEQEGEAAPGGGAGDEGAVGCAVAQGGQGAQDPVAVAGEDGGAVFQGAAGGGQGVGHVEQRKLRVGLGVLEEAGGLGAQGGGGAGGQDQRHAGRQGAGVRGGRGLRLLHVRGVGGLFDDGVDVGAAEAEGGDGGAAGPAGLGPRHGAGGQVDGTGVPVDVAGGGVHVQGGRDGAVAHRHDHLHDAGDAGRHLGVADVGLHRAEQQWPAGGPVLAVGGEEGLRLDGVAERGAGAVPLDHVDVGRGEVRVGEGLADHPGLGGAVGGGEAVGGAVLVDGGAADHGEHGVAVAAGVGEPFDQDEADALGEAHAVGALGVRLAAAVGGHGALAAEAGEGAGGGHDADAAGEGEGALAVAQRLAGQVQCDERGGAGGVQGDGRALQAEGVGEAAGHHAGDGAGDEVALGALGGGAARRVVLVAGADEGAGEAGAEGGGVDAGAFQDLPAGLQQEPLLRVHGEGLARRDPEEGGVEVGDVVEEAALGGVGGAGLGGVGVVEGVGVPAAVGGETGDGVAAGRDEVPQGLGGGDAAGVAAAHADNGDGLVDGGGGAHRSVVLGAGAADEAAQVRDEGERVRVVEDQGAREGEAGDGGEPVAQVDGGEGVEADVAEGTALGQYVRGGVAEDGGGLGADQVQQEAVLFAGGQRAQPAGELTAVGGAGLRLLGQAPYVGDVLEQVGGPRGGEHRVVAVPVDVGDGEDALVGVEGPPESGEGQLGVHEDQSAAADLAGVDAAELHVVGPDAPRDRGGAGATGAAVLGERVEVGVGGDVGGVPAAAPQAGGGGVEDEGVELVVVEEVVEVGGAGGLGVHDPGEGVEAGLVDRLEFDDGGGVEDAADGAALGGEPVQERGDGVPVGDVAGGDGGGAAAVGELGDEFGRSGRAVAAAAGEHQVAGALVGEPAGQVGAEGAGAAGDQDGAARAPAGAAGRGGRGGDAAGEDAGGADGELVLAGAAGEDGGEPLRRAVVEGLGQVDGAAPALRVFQRGGPAEAVHHGLRGVGEPVGAAGGDGPAGQRPQGRVDSGVAEGLHQGDGEREPGGQHGVEGAGVLGGGQQRHHAGGFGQVAQAGGDVAAVGVGVGGTEVQRHRVGAVRGERLPHGGGVGGVGAVGGDQQPGAGEGGVGQGAERLPGGAVAPGADGGAVAAPAAPGGQGGQDGGEGVAVQVQAGGEGVDVLLLDLGPELGVRGVASVRGARRRRLGPQVLALEGVGGQGCPAGAASGVDGGPVGAAAADPLLGEGGQEAAGAALFAAQGAGDGDVVAGLLGGGLHRHGEHGVRADLDEHGVPGAEEGAYGVLEADGPAQVAVPVGGVRGGGAEDLAGDRGVERHP